MNVEIDEAMNIFYGDFELFSRFIGNMIHF